ncbi:MAG: hypothetical protein IJ343_10530 [Clostridia bacterium]|nr:hypothetical protein [Clostridia bacterium]
MKKQLLLLPLLWIPLLIALLNPPQPTAIRALDAFILREAAPHADPAGFLSRASFVCYPKDYAGRPVSCFDASEDGQRIALGFSLPDGLRYAAVLDAEGTFLYGFSFRCTGDFMLDWTTAGLGIFWVRSDVFAVFDESGDCLAMVEPESSSASSGYLRTLDSPIRILPDGTRLQLRNKWESPASTWAQLVRIAPDGTETALCGEPGGVGSALVWPIAIIAMGVLMTWMLVRLTSIPKERRQLT